MHEPPGGEAAPPNGRTPANSAPGRPSAIDDSVGRCVRPCRSGFCGIARSGRFLFPAALPGPCGAPRSDAPASVLSASRSGGKGRKRWKRGGGWGRPRVTADAELPCTTEVGPAGRRHIVPIHRLPMTGGMRLPHRQPALRGMARVPAHAHARRRARAGDHTGGGQHPARSPPAHRPARQEDLGRATSVRAASADRRADGGGRRSRLAGHPSCDAGGHLPGGVPEELLAAM